LVAWNYKKSRDRKSDRSVSPEKLWKEPSDRAKLAERVKRIGRKKPGALLATFLCRAHERMGLGETRRMRSLDKLNLSHYITQKGNFKQVRDLNEASTLAQAIDKLRKGELESLGDLLAMRFVALEQVAGGKEWKVAEKWELREETSGCLGS
jgi:hypothetical protein